MKQTGSAYKSLKIPQNISGSCMILLHSWFRQGTSSIAKGTKNYYLRDGTGGMYKAKAEEKKESRSRNSIQQIFL